MIPMDEHTIREYLQHKPDCESRLCKQLCCGTASWVRHDKGSEYYTHDFDPLACTCGLDDLLGLLSAHHETAPRCGECDQEIPDEGDIRCVDCAVPKSVLSAPPARAHRCSGCGHMWDGPLTGAELCGDCWRKAQSAVHAAPPAEPQRENCYQCDGDGFVGSQNCPRCGGCGKERTSR